MKCLFYSYSPRIYFGVFLVASQDLKCSRGTVFPSHRKNMLNMLPSASWKHRLVSFGNSSYCKQGSVCCLTQQFLSRVGVGTEGLWYELCSRARKCSFTLSLGRGRRQWEEPSVIGKVAVCGEAGWRTVFHLLLSNEFSLIQVIR